MSTTIRDVLTGKIIVYKSIGQSLSKGKPVVRGIRRGRKRPEILLVCKDDDEAYRIALMLDRGGNWKRNGDIIVDDGKLPRRHEPDAIPSN